jgi:hypothetical protein
LDDRIGGPVDDVLAVVDDEQGGLIGRRIEERRERREAELLGDRTSDVVGRAHPGEVDQVHAERVAAADGVGDGERERGLADAAWTDHRHDPP